MTAENLQIEENIRLALESEEHQEFLHWFQKARELRLMDGDHNTEYFHFSTSVRRRFDSIEFVKVRDKWLEGTEKVVRPIVSSNEDIFRSSGTNLH